MYSVNLPWSCSYRGEASTLCLKLSDFLPPRWSSSIAPTCSGRWIRGFQRRRHLPAMSNLPYRDLTFPCSSIAKVLLYPTYFILTTSCSQHNHILHDAAVIVSRHYVPLRACFAGISGPVVSSVGGSRRELTDLPNLCPLRALARLGPFSGWH